MAFFIWLAPFDSGVSQWVELTAGPTDDPEIFGLQIGLYRASGDLSAWLRGNRLFVHEIRRQFLVWRALKPEQRERYVQLSGVRSQR